MHSRYIISNNRSKKHLLGCSLFIPLATSTAPVQSQQVVCRPGEVLENSGLYKLRTRHAGKPDSETRNQTCSIPQHSDARERRRHTAAHQNNSREVGDVFYRVGGSSWNRLRLPSTQIGASQTVIWLLQEVPRQMRHSMNGSCGL